MSVVPESTTGWTTSSCGRDRSHPAPSREFRPAVRFLTGPNQLEGTPGRVRVDDPTDELLSAVAKINDAPKAQVALHFLIKGLDDFIAESRVHGPQDAPRQAA